MGSQDSKTERCGGQLGGSRFKAIITSIDGIANDVWMNDSEASSQWVTRSWQAHRLCTVRMLLFKAV